MLTSYSTHYSARLRHGDGDGRQQQQRRRGTHDEGEAEGPRRVLPIRVTALGLGTG